MKFKFGNMAGIILIASLALSGCNLGASPASQPASDPGLFYTQAAQTMDAALTVNAVAATQAAPTETPLPPPTDTPTNTLEPTIAPATDTPTIEVEIPTEGPTETPVPSTPMLKVTSNTNCRAGPSPVYGIEGYVTTDMELPVYGINEGRSWWWVENPDYPQYHCWVWKFTSEVTGDTSMVPVYRDPWTMTPADPKLDVSLNVYPSVYKGVCPQEVTVVATIHSNRAAHIQYQWLRHGHVIKSAWITINADGDGTVWATTNVTADSDSYFNLKINAPIRYISEKQHYKINCSH
jgi:hypothetical protein